MDKGESLAEFLGRTGKSKGPILVVARNQEARGLAGTTGGLLPQAAFLDAESLTPEELEIFLAKKIQEEGTLIVLLTMKSPEILAGYLNTLFELNRMKISSPASWQTISPHPKFRILVVAEESALKKHDSLLKKEHFLQRYYATHSLEAL